MQIILSNGLTVVRPKSWHSRPMVRLSMGLCCLSLFWGCGGDPTSSIRIRATVSSIDAVVNFIASSVDTTNRGEDIVASTALAGDYVAAISISASPTTLGASGLISMVFNAEGLKGVRQFELRVQPEPSNAFDASGAVFTPTQPFVTPFASGIQIEGSVMRMVGASLSSVVDGAATLGTLTIRTSSTFGSFASARLMVTLLSIGPSSSQRDEFNTFDPQLGVAVTSE